MNQKLLTKIFQYKLGCTVNVVSNGKEALDYLSSPSAACPRPDIILWTYVCRRCRDRHDRKD